MMLAKLNLPFYDPRLAISVPQALQNVQVETIDPSRVFAVTRDPDLNVRPQFVVGDLNLNLLVGFGLRFFLGPLGSAGRRNEQPVANFPPGGAFVPRLATRFGMMDRAVPLYLRTMAAAGDLDWVRSTLAADGDGKPATDEAAQAAYMCWLMAGEADLLLQLQMREPLPADRLVE